MLSLTPWPADLRGLGSLKEIEKRQKTHHRHDISKHPPPQAIPNVYHPVRPRPATHAAGGVGPPTVPNSAPQPQPPRGSRRAEIERESPRRHRGSATARVASGGACGAEQGQREERGRRTVPRFGSSRWRPSCRSRPSPASGGGGGGGSRPRGRGVARSRSRRERGERAVGTNENKEVCLLCLACWAAMLLCPCACVLLPVLAWLAAEATRPSPTLGRLSLSLSDGWGRGG
jgi:hypothetical protein